MVIGKGPYHIPLWSLDRFIRPHIGHTTNLADPMSVVPRSSESPWPSPARRGSIGSLRIGPWLEKSWMILGSPVSRKFNKHQQMIVPQNCVIKPPIFPRTLSKKHHVESSPTPPTEPSNRPRWWLQRPLHLGTMSRNGRFRWVWGFGCTMRIYWEYNGNVILNIMGISWCITVNCVHMFMVYTYSNPHRRESERLRRLSIRIYFSIRWGITEMTISNIQWCPVQHAISLVTSEYH